MTGGFWRMSRDASTVASLDVGPSPCVWEVADAQFGGARLHVRRPDGSLYRGGLQFFVGSPTAPSSEGETQLAGNAFQFTAPPYVLPCVPPGRFSITMMSTEWKAPQVEFDVQAGAVSDVRIELVRR
jgi:hypothetical protein